MTWSSRSTSILSVFNTMHIISQLFLPKWMSDQCKYTAAAYSQTYKIEKQFSNLLVWIYSVIKQ